MNKENKVLLEHGSGGIMMKKIINNVFFNAYASNELLTGDDAAVLNDIKLKTGERLAFSSDSFVVNPHFFPGGDIGKLAVCGTVNDVSTSGATPFAISVSFILEEGYSIVNLKQICASIASAAKEAGVKVVTGDTKVVDFGKADGIFINTSGIGVVPAGINLSGGNCKPGDKIIVSGSLGDHGIAIMSQREGLNFSTDLKSDAAPLNTMIEEVLKAAPNVRCFRDPTRGGLASTLNEFAEQSGVDITIQALDVPIKSAVKSACEMLGYDPLQVANEGKMVCVVPLAQADVVLSTMRKNKYGSNAAIIGQIEQVAAERTPKVFIETPYGTKRILDMLVGEQLPRIC